MMVDVSRPTSYLFMLINTIVWGASLILVKPAFEITTPFRFLLYRYLIAATLFLPLLIKFIPQFKKLKKKLTRIVLIEILGGTISLSLLYFGLSMTTAIEASLIATTTPIFVSILAVMMLKEREEKHEIVGLSIAFIGTLMLTILPLITGQSKLDNISLVGNLLVVGQNVGIAFYYVLVKKYYQKIPKLLVAVISFYVCLITFFPLSILEAGGFNQLMSAIALDLHYPAVWLAGVYMAVFGSIIGFTAYLKGQEGIEASEATLFSYLQPLIYIPLGVWLLHETILPIQIGSLLLILASVVVAEKRRSKRNSKKRSHHR